MKEEKGAVVLLLVFLAGLAIYLTPQYLTLIDALEGGSFIHLVGGIIWIIICVTLVIEAAYVAIK